MSNAALPNDFIKYELGREIIDGIVTKMAPVGTAHSRTNKRLSRFFDDYFEGTSCEVFEDVYVHLSKKDIFAPDIAIVCDLSMIKNDKIYGAPELVVKILSRTTAHRDKVDKKKKYAKFGVKEYWIADPKAKDIEVYYLDDGEFSLNKTYYTEYEEFDLEVLTEEERAEITYEITTPLFEGLVVDVREVFKDIP